MNDVKMNVKRKEVFFFDGKTAECVNVAPDQPPDADAEARALFYTTRNGHGWTAPEWDELAEETRQNYREFVARRASETVSGSEP